MHILCRFSRFSAVIRAVEKQPVCATTVSMSPRRILTDSVSFSTLLLFLKLVLTCFSVPTATQLVLKTKAVASNKYANMNTQRFVNIVI